MKNVYKFLTLCSVPPSLHPFAIKSLEEAKLRSKHLNLKKWYTRLFKAKAISELLQWEDNRLIDVKSSWARHDIAPVQNITANGDNIPWLSMTQAYQDAYLNKNPRSEEYKEAVKSNYWCKGEHPRSKKSRKAWYRRNGGEYLAWTLGRAITPHKHQTLQKSWKFSNKKYRIEIIEQEGVWQINAKRRWLGPVWLDYRLGYELDNAAGWLPMEGFEFRATLVWTIVPCRKP